MENMILPLIHLEKVDTKNFFSLFQNTGTRGFKTDIKYIINSEFADTNTMMAASLGGIKREFEKS